MSVNVYPLECLWSACLPRCSFLLEISADEAFLNWKQIFELVLAQFTTEFTWKCLLPNEVGEAAEFFRKVNSPLANMFVYTAKSTNAAPVKSRNSLVVLSNAFWERSMALGSVIGHIQVLRLARAGLEWRPVLQFRCNTTPKPLFLRTGIVRSWFPRWANVLSRSQLSWSLYILTAAEASNRVNTWRF